MKEHEGGVAGCSIALLLIDFINDLEFEGGKRLLPAAVQAANATAQLKARARGRRAGHLLQR